MTNNNDYDRETANGDSAKSNSLPIDQERLRELIKPKAVETIYGNSRAIEALCVEFGIGRETDCRYGNAALDSTEDDLLF